jgi:hypothetical protein
MPPGTEAMPTVGYTEEHYANEKGSDTQERVEEDKFTMDGGYGDTDV